MSSSPDRPSDCFRRCRALESLAEAEAPLERKARANEVRYLITTTVLENRPAQDWPDQFLLLEQALSAML